MRQSVQLHHLHEKRAVSHHLTLMPSVSCISSSIPGHTASFRQCRRIPLPQQQLNRT